MIPIMKRSEGTNPRALGTNPRALGTNPRARTKFQEGDEVALVGRVISINSRYGYVNVEVVGGDDISVEPKCLVHLP
jgi:hypothetical protein